MNTYNFFLPSLTLRIWDRRHEKSYIQQRDIITDHLTVFGIFDLLCSSFSNLLSAFMSSVPSTKGVNSPQEDLREFGCEAVGVLLIVGDTTVVKLTLDFGRS